MVTSHVGSPAARAAFNLAKVRSVSLARDQPQRAAGLVERVALVAAVAEGGLLDTAADPLAGGVGDLDNVERIEYYNRSGTTVFCAVVYSRKGSRAATSIPPLQPRGVRGRRPCLDFLAS